MPGKIEALSTSDLKNYRAFLDTCAIFVHCSVISVHHKPFGQNAVTSKNYLLLLYYTIRTIIICLMPKYVSYHLNTIHLIQSVQNVHN